MSVHPDDTAKRGTARANGAALGSLVERSPLRESTPSSSPHDLASLDISAFDRLRRSVRETAISVRRDYGLVIVVATMFAYLSLATDNFLTTSNLLNLVDQQTTIGLIACAGTLVIIARGFDLSAGAIYGLSGVCIALLAPAVGTPVAMAIGVMCGGTLGLLNGVLAARMNPIIVTLATMIIFQGVARVVTGGFLTQVTVEGFTRLGTGRLGGMLWSSWVFFVTAIALGVVLHRHIFGRHVYAVGGNPEAAAVSGIPVARVRVCTYVISGMVAAVAAALYVSRLGVADPNAGSDLILPVIAAIVVGGTSISGGAGAIWRTVLGVMLLGMITNGFVLMQFEPTYQRIVEGAIILAAVGFDSRANARRGALR